MIRSWCLKNGVPLPNPISAEDVALAFAQSRDDGAHHMARSGSSSLTRGEGSVSEVASQRRRERAAAAARAMALAVESERQ